MVFPSGIKSDMPHTPIPCPPIPSHVCDAVEAAISYMYIPWVDDVFRRGPISGFPTVMFCEIQ